MSLLSQKEAIELQRCRSENGLTILEVTIAVFILTLSTTAIMQLIQTVDRVYWRSHLIENAVVLAKNEAEILKAQSPIADYIEELEYEREVQGRVFIVSRKVVENDSLKSFAESFPMEEIEIQIREYGKNLEEPLYVIRLLQGFGVATY